jgi:tetratricopeptide (TPR) repeat protein
MRITTFVTIRACMVFVIALASLSVFARASVLDLESQDKDKPKVSEAEAKAANAINSQPDAAAKLKAAEAFVKKYPKSEARQHVADYVADQIAGVKDATQKLSLAEQFLSSFTEQKEQDAITPVVIDAYLATNQTDDAFTIAAAFLTRNPDNVRVLVRMLLAGTDQAKRQNPKYIAQTEQYGTRAIQLLESDTNPLDSTGYKATLPQLYQSMGILALVRGSRSDARAKLEKAMSLSPSDPFNYLLLGDIMNSGYQEKAKSANSMPEGQPRVEAIQKANESLDQVIDVFAHALALMEGKPQFQQPHDQMLQDLTAYYKYRHKSTEGLQQLIDKYKAPSKP